MADWLETEACEAAQRVSLCHLRRLQSLGVSPAAWASIGRRQIPFGVATICEMGRGQFQPDPDGSAAVIVPVTAPQIYDGIASAWLTIHHIVDLVAFQTTRPAVWRQRTGVAWALSEHLLTEPDGEPVEIVSTPLAWLAAGGDAVCILDWSDRSPAWAYLRTGPELIVEDRFLEAKLRKAILRATPCPTIRRARG